MSGEAKGGLVGLLGAKLTTSEYPASPTGFDDSFYNNSSTPKFTVAVGSDAEINEIWSKMEEEADSIKANPYAYMVINQNSNSAAAAKAAHAGLILPPIWSAPLEVDGLRLRN